MKMRLGNGCLKIVLEAEKHEPESMFQILKKYPGRRALPYKRYLGKLYRHLKKKATEDCPIDIYQGEAMILQYMLQMSRDLAEEQSKWQEELLKAIIDCKMHFSPNEGTPRWR